MRGGERRWRPPDTEVFVNSNSRVPDHGIYEPVKVEMVRYKDGVVPDEEKNYGYPVWP